MFKRKTALHKMLKKHPGEMYVDDKIIALLLPDGRILVIPGDHRGITDEEANLKFQDVLRSLQQ